MLSYKKKEDVEKTQFKEYDHSKNFLIKIMSIDARIRHGNQSFIF